MKRGVIIAALVLAGRAAAQAPNSAWVYPSPTGNLLYRLDERGQRVADFPPCGYRGGTEPLPNVSALIPTSRWVRVSPGAGDDGVLVQAAIDAVEAMTPDSSGWRGVVYLNAGEYQLSNTITVAAGGVVLKGAGDSSTSGTRLRATAARQYTLISVGGSSSRSTVSGTTHNLTQKLVPAGARTFEVDSTSGLAAGHTVIVHRPSTTEWIADIDMDQLVYPWTEGSKDLHFDRVITRIEGNWITVDAPLPQTFESQYGGGQVWRYTWSGRPQQVGIEDLYGFSDYAGSTDEDHGWKFIQVNNAMHGWVRNITAQYFGYSAVSLGDGAKWITVADAQCLDPISIIDGGRRYSFNNEGAELALFVNCYARKGRHDFVFGATVPGPNAFVHGDTGTVYSDSGPHHRWSVGGLYDNLAINGNELNVRNRGNSGTGHGWAGAYMTVWNSVADTFRVRNPPTARNWLVGSVGAMADSGDAGGDPGGAVGADPAGTYDSSGPSGQGVHPRSLYYAQLQQRLKWPGSIFREAWIGDVDQHYSTDGGGNAANCDATWLAQVEAMSALPADNLFDYTVGNRYVAFTFDFDLDPGDTVVAASLTVSLRAVGSATGDRLWLDATNAPQAFADLGWTSIATTGSTVCTTEVDPALLADGRLNAAIGDDCSVDFAVLHLQVQPAPPSVRSVALTPVADAYVRGGAYATNNFGTAATLDTKDISDSDVHREAFLRWDLAGVTGRLVQAKVRLLCTWASQAGNENVASWVSNDTWGESTLTYGNKPAAGRFFAQWLPVAGEAVEFSVTPQVAEALIGDRKLSLKIAAADAFGGAGNVSYASSEYDTAAGRPQLILVFENAAPSASPFLAHATPEDTPTGPLAFTVADLETAATGLTVTVLSSNPALLPVSNVVVGVTTNPWTDLDLGAPSPAGVCVPGDVFTMSAGGADLWGTADEGHFLCQPMTGDGEMVARVASLQFEDPWAKAGVMMRANTNAGSANCYLLLSGTNGVSFQRRPISGVESASARVAGLGAPCWLRLVKTGTNYAGYYAVETGGVRGAWTQVGSTAGLDLGANPLRGLAGTSHSDGVSSTSVYDHVSGPPNAGGNRTVTFTPAPNASGTATVFLVVSDGSLSVTQAFTLVVTPVNDAPELAALSNRTIGAGQVLAVTNAATDPDLPDQTLAFGLLAAPGGATVGASSGIVTWRPAVAQANTTNLFRVRVADSGAPVLAATQQFSVVVRPLATAAVAQPAMTNGRFSMTIVGDTGPDCTVEASTNLVAWSAIFTTNSPPMPFPWTDPSANAHPRRFYRIRFGP